MSFQFECEDGTGVLTLTGSLTIERAGEFKAMLMANIARIDRMVVTLMDVSDVDLTWFQILCSAHRLYDSEKKVISFAPGSVEMVMDVMKRSGFTRKNTCGLKLKSDCLWTKGDDE